MSWHDWVHKQVTRSNNELNTIYRRCFRLSNYGLKMKGLPKPLLIFQERHPSKVKAPLVSSSKGAVDNRRRSQRLSLEPQQGLYQEWIMCGFVVYPSLVMLYLALMSMAIRTTSSSQEHSLFMSITNKVDSDKSLRRSCPQNKDEIPSLFNCDKIMSFSTLATLAHLVRDPWFALW